MLASLESENSTQMQLYIEAIEAEQDRLLIELKRASLLHPDLKQLKVNPNSQLKRHVHDMMAKMKHESILNRKKQLGDGKITVASGTEMCNLRIEIIEKFKTEKKNFRCPTVNNSTQYIPTKKESQLTQTFDYKISRDC